MCRPQGALAGANMTFFRSIAIILATGWLSACVTYDTTSGRNLEVGGKGFLSELYPRYVALSEERAAAGDPRDAEHFNHKARNAGYGAPVLPDAPMDRTLDEDTQAVFEAARYDLLLFFDDQRARERDPAVAADAQVAYDCWIEAAEANRSDDAARCRQSFESALAALASESADAPQPFVIYFAFDSAEVDGAGRALIDRAIAAAQRSGLNEFSVTGHTDRAGSTDYNAHLSLQRAEAVAEVLQGRGIESHNIFLAGRGESETAVPTADGVREQQNRRVEIVVQ